ncbi:PTS transporter subunit EIIC [Spiroplasma endosymbiont of Othius punctulatus]|uniref:PTS transporter subunit EIIC n=1 Tax=Spiroplasma endosymbiont of Othius punctulatus TaxID=3066289 RepID=UPI0030CC309B
MAGLVFKQKKRNKFQKKSSLKTRMKFSRDEINKLKAEIRTSKRNQKTLDNIFRVTVKNVIWEYKEEGRKIRRSRDFGPYDKIKSLNDIALEKETLINSLSKNFADRMRKAYDDHAKLTDELNRELMTFGIYKDRVKELTYSWTKTKKTSLTRKMVKDAKNNYKFAKQTTHSNEEYSRIKKYYKNRIDNTILEFETVNPEITNVRQKLRKMSAYKLNRLDTPEKEKLYDLLLDINENKYAGAKQITELKLELRDLKDQFIYIKGTVSFKEKMKQTSLSISSNAGKVTNVGFIYAIRNGYFSLMPLVLLGALAIFMTQIFFNYETGFMSLFIEPDNESAIKILDALIIPFKTLYDSTYGMLGILLAISIAYSLATFHKVNRLSAIVATILSFLIMSPKFSQDFSVFGTQGMFVGMFISISTTMLFVLFFKTNMFNFLSLRAYEKNLALAFVNAISVLIICLVFSSISVSIIFIGEAVGPVTIFEDTIVITSIYDVLLVSIQRPLVDIVTGPFGMPIILILWQALWFFGIHASGLLSTIIEPLQLEAIQQNASGTGENVFTKPFVEMFGQNGGAGATFALIVVILVFSKRHEWKTMAKIAIIPALFGINEPILFGLPIILNPMFFISFVLAPLAGCMIAYVATITGFMPYTTVITPWVTPTILGSFLSTGGSWTAIIVWLITTTSQLLVYLPVVLIANAAIKKDIVREMIRLEKRGFNRFKNEYQDEKNIKDEERNEELSKQFDLDNKEDYADNLA